MVIVIERDRDIDLVIATLRIAVECFPAHSRPVHRPPNLHCSEAHGNFLGTDRHARAERATRITAYYAYALLGQSEQTGKEWQSEVGRLEWGAEREIAGRLLPYCRACARLERKGGGAWNPDALFDDVRCGGEDRGHAVRVARAPFQRKVAGRSGMEKRSTWRQRGARIADRRERAVIDLDAIGGISRDMRRLGYHDRHCLAHVADTVSGESRPRSASKAGHGPAARKRAFDCRVQILSRPYAENTRRPARPLHIDAVDAGVRMRTAREYRVCTTGGAIVIREVRTAHYEACCASAVTV
jgi:hypothetical protein